jgi:hypothetical protein
MENDKLKKIEELEKNLIIFKNAIRNTYLKMETTFEAAKKHLLDEYNYRKILIKQIEIYKNAKQDEDEHIGKDDYEKFSNNTLNEKKELLSKYQNYNKITRNSFLESANDAILNEFNAHDFLLNNMSKLLDEILDLVGDHGESVRNEVESILLN